MSLRDPTVIGCCREARAARRRAELRPLRRLPRGSRSRVGPGRSRQYTTDDSGPNAERRASSLGEHRERSRPHARSRRSSGETGRIRRSEARRGACRAPVRRGLRERRLPARDRAEAIQWLWRRSSSCRNSASKVLRLASSSARFGMTTTSNPGAILLRRKTSRISLLARFLATAPPNFRVAAIPSRPSCRPFGRRKKVPNLPWTLVPRS